MAIFDIDKNSDDRSNPMPIRMDQIPAESVMAKQTLSTTHIDPTVTPTGQRIQMQNSQILALDSNNNAVALFGTDSTGNNVVKVAKTGYDARTATGNNLIFNSNQDVFKIANKIQYSTGTIAATLSTNYYISQTYTIPHGLSYTPIVNIYTQAALLSPSLTLIATSYVLLPVVINSLNSVVSYYNFPTLTSTYKPLNILYGVDATNVYLQIVSNTDTSNFSMASIPFTIFCLQETVN